MAVFDGEIFDLIGLLSAAPMTESGWRQALEAMSRAVGAETMAVEIANLETGEARIECPLELGRKVRDQYEERIFFINPRVHIGKDAAVGVLVDDSLIDDPTRYAEYWDWLEMTHTKHFQGAKLMHSAKEIGFLSTHYGKSWDAEKYGAEAEAVHKVLIPHVINALTISRTLSGLSFPRSRLGDDDLDGDTAFALIDRRGNIMQCSQSFDAILSQGDVFTSRGGRLAAALAQHRTRLDAFIGDLCVACSTLAPPAPIRLTPHFGRLGYVVRGMRFGKGQDLFSLFQPAAILFVSDLDRPRQVKAGDLAELFGLTPREADVAAAIGADLSLEAAVHALGISENTARQHLKSVFRKIGISSQLELVRIYSQL